MLVKQVLKQIIVVIDENPSTWREVNDFVDVMFCCKASIWISEVIAVTIVTLN